MSEIITGGCLCGSVRYEYTGRLEKASYCHCDDCRRDTGGPYTVGVPAKADALRIISGRIKGYTSTGDSGKEITRQFCPECGSPLFTRSQLHPDSVWIKAGSLDKPQSIKPTHQLWTQCAVPWAYIPDNLPTFPRSGPAPGQKIQ